MQSSADCDFSQNVSFETFHVAKKDQDSCNSELKVNNLLNSHKNTILAINCQNLVHNLEHLRLAMKSLKVKLGKEWGIGNNWILLKRHFTKW